MGTTLKMTDGQDIHPHINGNLLVCIQCLYIYICNHGPGWGSWEKAATHRMLVSVCQWPGELAVQDGLNMWI